MFLSSSRCSPANVISELRGMKDQREKGKNSENKEEQVMRPSIQIDFDLVGEEGPSERRN